MKPIIYKENISKPLGCGEIRKILETSEPNFEHPRGVEEHCKQCSSCHRYERELTGLRSLLAGQPRVTAPSDFDLKLRQRIAATRQRPGLGLLGWRHMWQPAGAFAALVVVGLLMGAVYLQYIQKPSHNPSPVATVTKPVQPAVSTPTAEKVTPTVSVPEEVASGEESAPAIKKIRPEVASSGRFTPVSSTRSSLSSAAAVTDEIMVTLGDEANTRTLQVNRVIYGAQPIVNLGDIVDTDDLESSSQSEESRIF
jgi:hypothetical protein